MTINLPERSSYKDVSTYLGISSITLQRWVKEKRFPQPVRYGPKTLRFLREDIERWIEEKKTYTFPS